jgi:hypothetical protein
MNWHNTLRSPSNKVAHPNHFRREKNIRTRAVLREKIKIINYPPFRKHTFDADGMKASKKCEKLFVTRG